MLRGARFSHGGEHRLWLKRQWSTPECDDMCPPKLANVVMLNPSVADAEKDDPTIRRIISLLQRYRFDGLVVTNAFSLVSTDPKALLVDPRSANCEFSDAAIEEASAACAATIVAWGAGLWHKRLRFRGEELQHLLRHKTTLCWGRTKHNQPRHPLYLPGTAKLEPYQSVLNTW